MYNTTLSCSDEMHLLPVFQQESIPVGCVPSAAVAVGRDGLLRGRCLPGGVCLVGVCLGECLPRGVSVRQPPLCIVNRMTDSQV